MGRGLRGHWHHKTAALRGPLERSAVERPLLPQQCMPSSFRENASLLVCESICTGPSALLFSHPPPPPSSGQCLILAQFLKCLQAQTLQQVWSARVCMCFPLRASHTACVYMLKACDICVCRQNRCRNSCTASRMHADAENGWGQSSWQACQPSVILCSEL